MVAGTIIAFVAGNAIELSLADAAVHPHNAARGLYRRGPGGELQAARAPRFLPLE